MKALDTFRKIGIITFHRAINYGAILQTYSLQKAYNDLNCDCKIIDYRNPFLEYLYKEKSIWNCKNLKDVAKYFIFSKDHSQRLSNFRKFSAQFLNLDHTCNSTEELKQISSNFDRIVCGSDQVWNYKISNFDKNFFLDFCNESNKKISYAASFGLDKIPEKYIEEYRCLLNKFSMLSVREKHGKKIVKDLTKRNAEIVLDPTMLISKSEWCKFATDFKKTNYILVYYFGYLTSSIKKFIENLSSKTGCKILLIYPGFFNPKGATYQKNVSPNEFVGLIKNARYVITNSFHGTVFSIVLNKDFFLQMLPDSIGVNSRLENILDLFELRNRLIINGKNVSINETIDYEFINCILQAEREKSLAFLKRTIEPFNE